MGESMKSLLYFALILGIILALTVHKNAYADNYTLVNSDALASQHAWDHIGMSYMVQTVLYGFSRRAFHFDRTDALIFSLVGTMMVNGLYATGDPHFGQSMVYGAVGAGL